MVDTLVESASNVEVCIKYLIKNSNLNNNLILIFQP